ncbi:hypothetical protein ASPWEDRAFT_610383 [Aspergillus wentii DTO 134E9]|uniref:Helicase C-terminal domain-containing protein n=1 Tax=Aspergillus wentii DTO 134E9 TaxID=1073089 RepID=A0A1L9RE54_ASPWE|nr:uncharacterized protein ASPWEDRAFT_610383 [Aspergillus wentii DTO 134E9]OJJ33147.1 hypothetical protein ASPWEDRAFT_610383 [Aspergillus wentii DTO 134E9]
MLLLKRYIGQRQAIGANVPKVVVMSATLDIDLFASYFQNRSSDGNLMPAPHVIIPGRTFAVRKHYLQDVLDSLSRVYSADVLGSLLNEESEMKYYLDRCKVQLHTNLPKPENQGSSREQEDSEKAVSKSPSDIIREEDSFVPLGLICAVIGYIFSTTKGGSILIFLPGIRYINAVTDFLRKYERLLGFDFSDEARFKILHLHSSLPEGQVELLGSVPSGCRRIILSTDIAETSITVPDVKFVIDPGKSHQNVYDPQSRYNRLACSWISRSSAAQRAGRAGRVQEGEYFALFTKEMHESMRIDRTPEIVRSDLQSACLLAKKLADIPAREFLLGCIQPPPDSLVELAVRNLQALQALDEQGNITALGRLLSGLPFDPSLAKLVLLGIIFRCLDPLLIVASLGSEMALMDLTPLSEQRKEALKIRQEYSRNTWSDHMSNINLFKATRDIYFQKGHRPAFEFAKSHFIQFTKFIEGLKVGQHVVTFLRINGHLPPSSGGDTIQFGGSELNMNSWRIPLIKSLLLHTLYPNLAAPLLVPKRYRTEKEEKVALNNTSVNSNLSTDSLLFFQRKKQSIFDGFFLMHDTSHVTPLAASLFGGRLQAIDGRIYVDSWLDFEIKVSGGPMEIQHAAKVVIEFRKALDKALMAAFETLATSERGFHAGQPMYFPNMTRDVIFNTLSNTIIDVLDRDFDPEYTRKRITAPAKWEPLRKPSPS